MKILVVNQPNFSWKGKRRTIRLIITADQSIVCLRLHCIIMPIDQVVFAYSQLWQRVVFCVDAHCISAADTKPRGVSSPFLWQCAHVTANNIHVKNEVASFCFPLLFFPWQANFVVCTSIISLSMKKEGVHTAYNKIMHERTIHTYEALLSKSRQIC